MTNFTPGKWEVWDYDTPDTRDTGFGGRYKRIMARSSTAIAEVASFIGNPADARAIAEVPEMVELIKEFVPVLPIDEEVVQEHYIKLSERAATLLHRIKGEQTS